jgi:hypothetical protein
LSLFPEEGFKAQRLKVQGLRLVEPWKNGRFSGLGVRLSAGVALAKQKRQRRIESGFDQVVAFTLLILSNFEKELISEHPGEAC